MQHFFIFDRCLVEALSATAVIVDGDCDIGTSLIMILFFGLGEYLVCSLILHVVLI